MNNPTKDKLLQDINQLIDSTDEVLNSWSGDTNLQFPVLLGMIAVRNNWDEKQVRRADPFVREYIRNHPEWYVTRGAHGGIMRAADKNKKEQAKLSKELTKKQMKSDLEAKVAAMESKVTSQVTSDVSEDDSAENE
jgi:hypothetical protein